jgi:acetate kinase
VTVSTATSRTAVLVIATDEELEIARQAAAVLATSNDRTGGSR